MIACYISFPGIFLFTVLPVFEFVSTGSKWNHSVIGVGLFNRHELGKSLFKTMLMFGILFEVTDLVHTVARLIASHRDIIKSTILVLAKPFIPYKVASTLKGHFKKFPVFARFVEQIMRQIHSVDLMLNRNPCDRGERGQHIH